MAVEFGFWKKYLHFWFQTQW